MFLLIGTRQLKRPMFVRLLYATLILLLAAVGPGLSSESQQVEGISEAGKLPPDAFQHDNAWSRLMNSADKAYKRGDYQTAERDWRRAVEEAEHFEAFDIRKAKALNNLAQLLAEQFRCVEAEMLAKTALGIWKRFDDQKDPIMVTGISRGLTTLGEVYDFEQKYADSDPLYREALAALQKIGGDGPLSVEILVNLSQLDLKAGKNEEAKANLTKAMSICKNNDGGIDRALVMQRLALLEIAEHRPAQAVALAQEALQIAKTSLPPRHPQLSPYLNVLAEACMAADRFRQSVSLFETELALLRRIISDDSPEVKTVIARLSEARRLAELPRAVIKAPVIKKN